METGKTTPFSHHADCHSDAASSFLSLPAFCCTSLLYVYAKAQQTSSNTSSCLNIMPEQACVVEGQGIAWFRDRRGQICCCRIVTLDEILEYGAQLHDQGKKIGLYIETKARSIAPQCAFVQMLFLYLSGRFQAQFFSTLMTTTTMQQDF